MRRLLPLFFTTVLLVVITTNRDEPPNESFARSAEDSTNVVEIRSTELTSASPSDYSDTHAERDTSVIQKAVNTAKPNMTVLLPKGHFVVKTIHVSGKPNLTIRGRGANATTLRRANISWDNDKSGACPHSTEVLLCERSDDLTIADLTLDGNGHHMAIKGKGSFAPNRKIATGTPQFPSFVKGDGTALNVKLCRHLTITEVAVINGFRWAVCIGQVKDFTFARNVIKTGKLSTEFKAHWDAPPNHKIPHVHTSQDGLHLVNVVNGKIVRNTIESEDSAIAIEANPAWDWWTFPGENSPNTMSRHIEVRNNYLRTNSPSKKEGLLTDERIYGTHLATKWVGQGGVDIFYNERWDVEGKVKAIGTDSRIQDILIHENAIENARYGVRAGFFVGANAHNVDCHVHRIKGLKIKNHTADVAAGRSGEYRAGIRHIRRNDVAESWNRSGGVAVAVRNADDVEILNNQVEDVTGGTGIEVIRTTQFKISHNSIRKIVGTRLADEFRWDGGEGIRIWNAPTDQYDAGSFVISGNTIRDTASYGIFITNTQNGRCLRSSNSTIKYRPFAKEEPRGIFIRECAHVAQ